MKEEISIPFNQDNNKQKNDIDYLLITIGFYLSFISCNPVFSSVIYCLFQNNESPQLIQMRSNVKTLMLIQSILLILFTMICIIEILIYSSNGSK